MKISVDDGEKNRVISEFIVFLTLSEFFFVTKAQVFASKYIGDTTICKMEFERRKLWQRFQEISQF